MNRITKLLYRFGLIFMFATTLTFCYTFVGAYYHNYQVLITINDYGEAHIEFWMMIIGMISMLTYIVLSWKDFFSEVG